MTAAIVVAVLATTAAVGLAVALGVNRAKTRRQIDDLICYLEKVQDRTSLPELAGQGEGRMKILRDEVCKLSGDLVSHYRAESRKSTYLADMLANVSHQIKTPLAAITIMTDCLKDGNLTEEQRASCIRNIESQTDRMTWLVRTLLAIAQLDAGVLQLGSVDVDAGALVGEVVGPLEPLADIRDIELRVDVPAGAQVCCDRRWTVEALSNVVKNCLEHTPEGGNVTVELRRSSLATDILVTDTGPGIGADDLPHVFDRFYRGPQSCPDNQGIGLALAKQIMLNQNGTLEVENVPDGGARFRARLYATPSL